jgi:hypothetical protein
MSPNYQFREIMPYSKEKYGEYSKYAAIKYSLFINNNSNIDASVTN